MQHIITQPYTREKLAALKTGDRVLLSGTIYAARDTAHRRLVELIEEGRELPFELKGAIVYYVGCLLYTS